MQTAHMLDGIRVLDLASSGATACGKFLGDMGADVIKVEPPGGDLSRNTGPFYHHKRNPERSLYWWAYNTSKRGITLDLSTAKGRSLLGSLVEVSDVLVESYGPGYLESLDISYEWLSNINPRLILTRISPFGQHGPYREFKASDIVCMAMSGCLYLTGDPDRRPVTISLPHAFAIAGAEASAATAVALFDRENTGKGQWIDVSVQQVLFVSSHDAWPWWAMSRRVLERAGPLRKRPQAGVVFRQIWPCKDGYVTWVWYGGLMGAQGNAKMVELMERDGVDVGFLKDTDWRQFSFDRTTQAEVDRREEATLHYFSRHTRSELSALAFEHNLMLYTVATAEDILTNQASTQLEARGFWIDLKHEDVESTVKYCGPWIRATATPVHVSRRAPMVGEHNQEVYQELLGLTEEALTELRSSTVI